MRFYETMFIVKPTLVEDEIKERINFFKDVILKNNGEIETCLDMGMRNLAYQINKNNRGYYYVIYFRAEPSLILELQRLYGISEDILRFIVIKYESKKEQKQWQTLVDRANKKPGSYIPFKKSHKEDRGDRFDKEKHHHKDANDKKEEIANEQEDSKKEE